MNVARSCRDLEVYKLAFEAAMDIFKMTKTFPKESRKPRSSFAGFHQRFRSSHVRASEASGHPTSNVLRNLRSCIVAFLLIFSLAVSANAGTMMISTTLEGKEIKCQV